MKYTIDAKDQKLGRLASKVANLLMGKNEAAFTKNAMPTVTVEIVNAAKIEVSEKKLTEKLYKNYSGYPGGLRIKNMKQVIGKLGHQEVISDAIYGMLPKNKLQRKMMKNLTITA